MAALRQLHLPRLQNRWWGSISSAQTLGVFSSLPQVSAVGSQTDKLRLQRPFSTGPLSWRGASWLDPMNAPGGSFTSWVDPFDMDYSPDLSEKEIHQAQRTYAKAIKQISGTYYAGGDYAHEAKMQAMKVYATGDMKVVFKNDAETRFRLRAAQAMSFIAGDEVSDPHGLEKLAGYAVNGSKGWSDIRFENHQIEVAQNVGIATGKYYLTSAESSGITEAEYTFGYRKDEDGKVGIFFHNSSVPVDPTAFDAVALISEKEVNDVQTAWANAIKSISKTYLDGGDYVAAAAEAADELYGYGHEDVLFKPTKAAEAQFRPNAADAMSYFVGHQAVEGGYAEDSGFAINSGKGWSDVVFENHQIKRTANIAIAMGNYYFTCAQSGNATKVEYTFGYKKMKDGKPRIFLHHSSVPYDPDTAFIVSAEEVQVAQDAWACAIKSISKTYLDGGDYVAAASKAAGELYGYGHEDVLFKPTKAVKAQFRPSASDAMSYFVGHQAVEGGHAEDTGFAINSGNGWSEVVFENHATKQTGDLAIAMGNYYFTCAKTAVTTKVEYTFGYKKGKDGNLRIFLHHSSVPYSS